MLTPTLVVRESCGAYLSRPEPEPVTKKTIFKTRGVKEEPA